MRLLGRRARFRGLPLLPRPAVVSGCLSLRLSPQSFRRIDHSFDLGCLHAAVQPHAHALGADGARQARGAPALSFSRRSRARTRTGRGLCSSGQFNRCAGRSWGAQGGQTCPYERARRRAARTPLGRDGGMWGAARRVTTLTPNLPPHGQRRSTCAMPKGNTLEVAEMAHFLPSLGAMCSWARATAHGGLILRFWACGGPAWPISALSAAQRGPRRPPRRMPQAAAGSRSTHADARARALDVGVLRGE